MAHITSAEAISRFAPVRLTGGTKFPRVPPPASGGAWNDFYLEWSNDKMGYIHFSEEQKLRAGSVDLVEFLARRGEKLLRSGNDKRLASDKSITVRGGGWYDHAAERGGNAISFVREFYGYSYPGAVLLLLGGQAEPAPNSRTKFVLNERQVPAYKAYDKSVEGKSPQMARRFALPNAYTDMRRVYAYLLKQRHIDRDVHFARENTIFEDAEPHNAVFVGCDENGVPRHAHKKSTSTLGSS